MEKRTLKKILQLRSRWEYGVLSIFEWPADIRGKIDLMLDGMVNQGLELTILFLVIRHLASGWVVLCPVPVFTIQRVGNPVLVANTRYS